MKKKGVRLKIGEGEQERRKRSGKGGGQWWYMLGKQIKGIFKK